MSNTNNNSSVASGGIGFTGLLTVAFIVLKLCNVITWSWFWVLSPLIFSVGLVLLILLVIVLLAIIEGQKG